MNCQFCQQELRLSHHENEELIAVYDCVNCPVLTSFYYRKDDNNLTKITYMIDRHDKLYLWTNNYVANDSYIIDLTAGQTTTIRRDPILIKFAKIMNINPTNVQEKFSFFMTYL